MRWTTERPTKPGWYWWRANAESFESPHLIDRVGDIHGGDVLYCATCDDDHMEERDGQWAGPIPEPEEEGGG